MRPEPKSDWPLGSIHTSFSDPSRDGDVFEVVAEFPGHTDHATAIAVLAWAASRQAATGIDAFLEQVRAEAAHLFEVPPIEPVKPVGGVPAFDWVASYGKSKEHLHLLAIVLRGGWDKFGGWDESSKGKARMTKSEARRQALILSGKVNLGRSGHVWDTIVEDAERLKQALRPSPESRRRLGET